MFANVDRTNLISLTFELKFHFEERELTHLSSQMREAIAEEMLNNLKSLKRSAQNGNKIGNLRFVSMVRSIALKQFNVTFRFANEQSTRVRIQGCDKTFRFTVRGGKG